MEPVGVGLRAVAAIIDSIILTVVGYLIAAATGNTTGAGFHIQGVPFFLWMLVSIGYYVAMEGRWGATLGKRAVGLKVVKAEGGGALDWQAAIVRNVLRIVDGFFFYLVGAIIIWTSKRRQRLGDMVAHTLVVRARAAAVVLLALALSLGGTYAPPAFAAPRFEGIELSDAKVGAKPKQAFKPDTAKIFLNAKVLDAAPGTRLRSDWIAVKAQGAPANYKIDSSEVTTAKGTNQVTFSFSKPTAGWPVGDYRIDLFVDGKPATQVKFMVAP
jgi:uncharacterized RDD family membrane protein YckC